MTFSKLYYMKLYKSFSNPSNPISSDLQCGVLMMKSTTHPNPLCPAIEEDCEVGLLLDWLIDWHITYDGARLPFTTFHKFPFSVVSLCLYCFWNPSFKLPVSWPISSGLYLLCMAWCTWKTRLSPIWLILALQDVKGSIQYSMHAVELHSGLCLWFITSGCPLFVCSLARLYNPWMTLPTLQHPGYVHSMREQSSRTHRLPTTRVRTQKHLNCVIASLKCREKT